MPASVSNAAPATVMPLSLNKSFAHARPLPVLVNEYRNGEYQGSALAETSRRSWRLGKLLTATDLATLRTFYFNRKGPHQPFYFYDPWSYHDPTGTETTGRYIVRFNSPWNQLKGLTRLSTDLELIEIA